MGIKERLTAKRLELTGINPYSVRQVSKQIQVTNKGKEKDSTKAANPLKPNSTVSFFEKSQGQVQLKRMIEQKFATEMTTLQEYRKQDLD